MMIIHSSSFPFVSVTMTIISTVMSVGMIPILFFFVTDDVSMETVEQPTYALIVALLHITVPLLIGMICRKLLTPVWNRIIIVVSRQPIPVYRPVESTL